MSHHVTSHHGASHHIKSHHVTSQTSQHVTSHHVASHHVASCRIMSHSHHVTVRFGLRLVTQHSLHGLVTQHSLHTQLQLRLGLVGTWGGLVRSGTRTGDLAAGTGTRRVSALGLAFATGLGLRLVGSGTRTGDSLRTGTGIRNWTGLGLSTCACVRSNHLLSRVLRVC